MATTSVPRRLEGAEKVTGRARYAVEHHRDEVTYAWIVQADAAPGRVKAIETEAALRSDGVLAVVTHENAERLQEVDDHELSVLQSPDVAYRGQIVAAVVATSLEAAREGARLVRATIGGAGAPDVELRTDHPSLYAPDQVNGGHETDTSVGDFDAGFAGAPVRVDVTYATPAFHNNAMEPHATLAWWEGGTLVLQDSNQGAAAHRDTLAEVFDLPPERVRVLAEHVGGGFGSKGTPRPNAVLAAMLARIVGRPVKLAVTRQQMFAFTGYRSPTIQRLRLGAGADGRLVASGHDSVVQSSTIREFAEQCSTPSRSMYAAPHRRTTHRLARLDVATPSWMRAPGECPGMYALESAMDELAVAVGLDPIELRVRNDTGVDPETGAPFTSRNLVACLRRGAERFGWAPGQRREGRELVGQGVAASAYPTMLSPASARARALGDGRVEVAIAAADIGTGARTVLAQIAAEALGTGLDAVAIRIGDSALPQANVAGGSMGTSSWGAAVHKACTQLRSGAGDEVVVDTNDEVEGQSDAARSAFGAHFCEVRVDGDSGEIRVGRMLGVFAAGRIVNPVTARSQLIGGMTMGIGMALMEESVLDREFGDYLNKDLAQYHVPVHADVGEVDAEWLDEDDQDATPIGTKGIGEIGIVGAAAAIGNAVHDATGVRFRSLPIQLDALVGIGDRPR